MAKSIANVQTTDTFQAWLDKTNEIVNEFANVVTVAGTPATGNAIVNGSFSSNNLFVKQNIYGGVAGTPAALAFGTGSNVTFNSNVSVAAANLSVSSNTTFTGNVTFGAPKVTFGAISNLNFTATITNNKDFLTINATSGALEIRNLNELLTLDDIAYVNATNATSNSVLAWDTAAGNTQFKDIAQIVQEALQYSNTGITLQDASVSTYAPGANGIAAGSGANATGISAIAVGVNAVTHNNYAVAIGYLANSTGDEAVAIGNQAKAVGSIRSIAIGSGANSFGTYSVAVGHSTDAASNSVAIGPVANAQGSNSVAVGASSQTNGDQAVSIGSQANSQLRSISIGYNSGPTSGGNNHVLIGANTTTNTGISAVAVGNDIKVYSGNGGIAIGRSALLNTTTIDSIVIGTGARIGNTSVATAGGTVIGSGAVSNASSNSVVIGKLAVTESSIETTMVGDQTNSTSSSSSVVIGSKAWANGAPRSIVIGATANVFSDNTMVIGYGSYTGTTANNSMVMGCNSFTNYANTITIGSQSNPTGTNSVSVGHYSGARYNATAVGFSADAYANATVAIGKGAAANGTGSIALGYEVGTTYAAEYSVAIGYNFDVTTANTIALGANNSYFLAFNSIANSNLIPVGDTWSLGNTTNKWLEVHSNTFVGGLTGVVTGNVVANTITINELTDNQLVIAGSGGVLEGDANLTFTGSLLTVNASAQFSNGSGAYVTANSTSGRVGLGVADPDAILEIDGDLLVSGDVTTGYTSDQRLKENVVEIADPLDKVAQLRGVNFDWKQGIDDNFSKYISPKSGHDIGVIAQEVEAVVPEAVRTYPDGWKGVDYTKLVPVLIEAIKHLNNRVVQLESQVNNGNQG